MDSEREITLRAALLSVGNDLRTLQAILSGWSLDSPEHSDYLQNWKLELEEKFSTILQELSEIGTI